MVASERTLLLDKNGTFYNDQGSSVEMDELKAEGWVVYVGGECDKGNKKKTAKRVYLLAGQVKGKNKHLYPFME
jgi:G:T-mismatch repair DNA endonuclease (very short patch repair protein)